MYLGKMENNSTFNTVLFDGSIQGVYNIVSLTIAVVLLCLVLIWIVMLAAGLPWWGRILKNPPGLQRQTIFTITKPDTENKLVIRFPRECIKLWLKKKLFPVNNETMDSV